MHRKAISAVYIDCSLLLDVLRLRYSIDAMKFSCQHSVHFGRHCGKGKNVYHYNIVHGYIFCIPVQHGFNIHEAFLSNTEYSCDTVLFGYCFAKFDALSELLRLEYITFSVSPVSKYHGYIFMNKVCNKETNE